MSLDWLETGFVYRRPSGGWGGGGLAACVAWLQTPMVNGAMMIVPWVQVEDMVKGKNLRLCRLCGRIRLGSLKIPYILYIKNEKIYI